MNEQINEAEYAEVLEEKDYKPEKGLIKLDDILPLLQMEAESKGLTVFQFSNEEVNAHFNTKRNDFSIVLLAKDESNALYNLKNLRRCYAVTT